MADLLERSERPHALIAFVPAAGAMLATLDLFIVNIAFPDIKAAFPGTTTAGLSWVLTAYSVVFAALLVPSGRLADRFGRRRLFRAGMASFTAASAICAIAPSLDVLIAGRVLQAIGAALMVPTSLGLMLAASPPERHRRVVATWAAIGSVAAAAGPPVGGLLVEASWRWVFLVNLPISLTAVFLARKLPEQKQGEEAGLPDLLGAILLALGIGAIVAAVSQANAWGAESLRLWAFVIAGTAAVGVFVRRCATHPRPVLHLGLMRYRAFSASTAAMLFFYAGFAASLLCATLYLTQIWHWGSISAGLGFAPGPIFAGLFGVLTGRLSINRRFLAVLGGLVFAAGAAWWWVALTGASHDYSVRYLPGLLLIGAGVGLTQTSVIGAGTAAVPAELYSTGAGVINTARQIGSALGVAVLVALLGNVPGVADFRSGWILVGLGGVTASLAALFLTEPDPVVVEDPVAQSVSPGQLLGAAP